MFKTPALIKTLPVLILALTCSTGLAKPKKKEPVPLTPAGENAQKEYASMLDALRSEIEPKLPKVDAVKKGVMMEAYDKKKVSEAACLKAAEPILADLEGFLSSGDLDAKLVKGAVLADSKPRDLAVFAQQGPAEKKLVDQLLSDAGLMKEMLLAGGAKAGRYGKAMQIREQILSKYPRAKDGVFHRLALAVALEFAAPELCGYQNVDPVKRYAFYETSYVEKELMPHFDQHSTWLLRHVVNDPQSESDMLWMREMLWNYRPDQITAVEAYNAHVVGLMYSEFGHKRLEYDENFSATRLQQTIDRGGQCGPKAFFGRCLGRSFGIPVWGARLRSHTAMAYWTPKGWMTILGVSFKNGFWTVDLPDSMRGTYFLNIAKSRNAPFEYVKACRADWVSSVLGEEKVKGMEPNKAAGIWSTLAVNKRRSIAAANEPAVVKPDPNAPKPPKIQGYPERVVRLQAPDELKKIRTSDKGVIHIPAVACTSPTASTDKIVFMKTRDGGMNLHYKRWELPEPLTYEVDVPKAGKYEISADVVTVNREQFFLVATNGSDEAVRMEMPYTVGAWGVVAPVSISLKQGKNVLTLTRTIMPNIDFEKEAYKHAGPEFGGITIKEFKLKPVN